MSADDDTPFIAATVITSYWAIEEFLRSDVEAPRRRPMADFIEVGCISKLHGHGHLERRRLENVLFRPKVLADYEQRVLRGSIADMLAALGRHRDPDGVVRADLIEALTRQTIGFAALIVGVDDIDDATKDDLCEVMDAGIEGIKIEYSTGDQTAIAERASDAMDLYWNRYIAPARERRRALLDKGGADALPHDLISVILRDGADEWDDGLLLRECMTYLMGVGGTTTVLLGHVVADLGQWLTDHPDRRGDLASDEFLTRAIEESTRLHPPAPAVLRVCAGAFDGATFTAADGETVYLDLVKANRDRELFGANADDYDPDRAVAGRVPRYGLSFGAGHHACIGRPMFVGGHGTGTTGVGLLVLRPLVDAGIELDPNAPPEMAASLEARHTRLPVVFRNL